MRLRVPEKRGDPTWLAELRSRLLAHPAIESVTTNPVLGSILLVFTEASAVAIEEYLGTEMGLDLTNDPPPLAQALSGVTQAVDVLDQMVGEMTAGGADLRTLAFLVFLGLALRQALRGEVLGPALPLVWYAFDLLRDRRPDLGP